MLKFFGEFFLGIFPIFLNLIITFVSSAGCAQDEFIEDVVCQESDIGENEMKNFDLGGSKVLIVKQNGKISALGTKCTHYGKRKCYLFSNVYEKKQSHRF